jgi:poly-gamma-glutamate synthesis protein (capsule biosynthesis protein)
MAERAEAICLFLSGDVMIGRGIDQVLPNPGSPVLHEACIRDAREYVQLAEEANGPITRPAAFEYIWGDALVKLDEQGTDVRIVNLETSITSSADYWHDKDIHYRMHPLNIGCLTVARVDCCCLANNHVLDWGYEGLVETLQTLDKAGLAHAGAGGSIGEAASPVVVNVPGKSRVIIYSCGSTTSGIPSDWAATTDRPGVNLLVNLSHDTAQRVADWIGQSKRPGEAAIVSIHWGDNWGYEIPDEQIQFAHRLIEAGVDVVHGHSSHHAKAIEVYQDRPIFYGCGDFLTDYEGIRGHESFRCDLALMYVVKLDPQHCRLVEARLVPMQSRRFRLCGASTLDARWLCDLLNTLGRRFGTQIRLERDNDMILQWE